MIASIWLVAALACAQGELFDAPAKPVENVPPLKPAASKVVAVTVYRGQALVTREAVVPEGEGSVELVVTPMPPQVVEGSLHAEGADGLRVLSTRFRTRAVRSDTRKDVGEREDELKRFRADEQAIQRQIAVQGQDLQYLQKLEGFTGTSLTGLTEKGRLDSEAVVSLSRFLMETRAERSKSEVDLKQKLQANAEAAEFSRKQLAELPSGSNRTERDAVIVVRKAGPQAGVVKLSYLVGAANWWPQYRLRGAADDAPVRLDYLAAVTQQTGEDWTSVRVTLSTARPSLDAAPPDLLPLKMAASYDGATGQTEANDDQSRKIAIELSRTIDMPFKVETPLEDVIKYVRTSTKSPAFPEGIPIYVDPIGLSEAEKTMASPVVFDVPQIALRVSLMLILKQLGMTYEVKDGLLTINSIVSAEQDGEHGSRRGGFQSEMAIAPEAWQDPAAALLNQKAAGDQAQELQVTDGVSADQSEAEKDAPSVAFPIEGLLDIPSRTDPQLLEVGRLELPADYYAKAVPVLTSRVYRLAKLTNKSELVLLPGEATVHVGDDFVGRMRLPLVAAGEPFVAGFGIDPQLQVARRLIRKTRTVQGGNQIFSYEFRIGLRNYRSKAVKVQLWDRLPFPQGEAVAVNLVSTTAELSKDAMYLRTARMDNLLRWDLEVPAGTIGEKPMYINYEFRLEYAKDLALPQFLSGGLKEAPIGGGAMGGMGGGMGGGMRSMKPNP